MEAHRKCATTVLMHTCSWGAFAVDRRGLVDFAPMLGIAVDMGKPFAPPYCEMCFAFRKALVVAVGMIAE